MPNYEGRETGVYSLVSHNTISLPSHKCSQTVLLNINDYQLRPFDYSLSFHDNTCYIYLHVLFFLFHVAHFSLSLFLYLFLYHDNLGVCVCHENGNETWDDDDDLGSVPLVALVWGAWKYMYIKY